MNRLIFFAALFGILVVVHLWIQTGRGFDRGCMGFSAPSEPVGCSAVVESEAGQLMGVSNVIWGLLFYVGIVGLSVAKSLVPDDTSVLLKRISFTAATVGFLYSVYLVMVQAFALETFCVLCLISAGTVAVLFGLHVAESMKQVIPGSAGRDLRLFAVAGTAVLALAVVDVLYFNSLESSAPEVAAAPATASGETITPVDSPLCSYTSDPVPLANVGQFIMPEDPYLGDEDAPVRVVKFFDPNCPHCKSLNETMEPVIASSGDKAKFYFRPFPIWPISLPQVQALYLAREQGKFIEMMEEQFRLQKQGGIPHAELVDIAEDLGLDVERFRTDLRSGKYVPQILREKQAMTNAGITNFPKLAIEGQFVASTVQAMSAGCISHLIDEAYEARTASASADTP